MYVCGARQWCSQDVYVARAQVSADGAILRPEAPRNFFCKTLHLFAVGTAVLKRSCASSLSWVSSGHVYFR